MLIMKGPVQGRALATYNQNKQIYSQKNEIPYLRWELSFPKIKCIKEAMIKGIMAENEKTGLDEMR